MRKSKATKIIERIAAENGISVAEVRVSMQEAIAHAYQNHDGESDAFWSRWKEKPPAPEEFISRANKEVLARLNFNKVERQ